MIQKTKCRFKKKIQAHKIKISDTEHELNIEKIGNDIKPVKSRNDLPDDLQHETDIHMNACFDKLKQVLDNEDDIKQIDDLLVNYMKNECAPGLALNACIGPLATKYNINISDLGGKSPAGVSECLMPNKRIIHAAQAFCNAVKGKFSNK